MADEPLGTPGEEEYTFTESDAGDAFGPGTSKQGVFEKVKRKNILIIVFVIVVAFSVYQLLSFFFSARTIKKEKPAKVAVVKEVAQPEMLQPEMILAPESLEALTLSEKPLALSDQSLATSLAPVHSNIQANATKLDTIETTLDKVNKNISAQTEHLAKIDQTLRKTTALLSLQQAKLKVLMLRHESKMKSEEQDYYVQATVPGRAWLRTKAGKVISVRVGDKVPGYGTVQAIDSQEGMVITNTGDVITHSPDDS